MRNETRILYNSMLTQVASLNGVTDATVSFSVAPVVEQKLEEVNQQSSDFLQRINFITVDAQEGQKVGVGVTRPIASRTQTDSKTAKRRRPTDPTDTGDRGKYRCEITHSDVAIKYAKLDQWRHRPEFQTLVRDTIVKQQGRDIIMIGWNGVNAAADTDIATYPLLQDVNYGWLSLAYEKGLTWGDRFLQFTIGTIVSYFARGVIVALFDLHTFVVDGIVFTAGMIAFRATPRFASATIDALVSVPVLIRDRFVGGGK